MRLQLRSLIKTGDENFIEIIKHAFWAIVFLGATTAIQFIYDILLSRKFGAHGTGIFYLSFSVIMVLALLGRLGLDQAIVRFMPPLLSTDPEKSAGVKRSAAVLSLYITFPLALILFLLAPWIANEVFHSNELAYYLKVFAFAIPPLSMNYIFSGVLKSLKKTQAALSIERFTMYGLGIIGVLILGGHFGLKGVVVGFVISIYISTLLGYYYISKKHPPYKSAVPFSKKKLLITSGPLLFVAFANQLIGQASVLILGATNSNTNVGIFNIALKVSLLMSLILAAINVIAATKFSELYAAGKKRELSITISKISALGTLVGVPLFLIIVIFSETLLNLFGNEFIAGTTALIILAAGQLANVSVGSTNYVLAMTGHERALATAVGASLFVNILLGLILIPEYGVAGASVTTAATLIVSNIIMVLMVKHFLGVWQLPFKYLSVWFSKL